MGIFLEVTNTYRKIVYEFNKNKLNENIRVALGVQNGKFLVVLWTVGLHLTWRQ